VSLLIGVDEAGYGPNLGPLLVATTAWEVPGDPAGIDLYEEFAGLVTRTPTPDASTLTIADSKQVYSPATGLAPLERGVWSALNLWDPQAPPRDDVDLIHRLQGHPLDPWQTEPWWVDGARPIPRHTPAPLTTPLWATRCRERGIRLRWLAIDLVSPRRFNEWNERTGSKGRTLSELTLALVGRALAACQPGEDQPVLVLADKHGGRNRYQEFLAPVFGNRLPWALEEGALRSRYAAGPREVRFEVGSERHLPTALASMLAKYVRELAMERFNTFWQHEIPGLQPTAGYPTDARRFRAEIHRRREALGIPETLLWRTK